MEFERCNQNERTQDTRIATIDDDELSSAEYWKTIDNSLDELINAIDQTEESDFNVIFLFPFNKLSTLESIAIPISNL